jgi:hypothetical protein
MISKHAIIRNRDRLDGMNKRKPYLNSFNIFCTQKSYSNDNDNNKTCKGKPKKYYSYKIGQFSFRSF